MIYRIFMVLSLVLLSVPLQAQDFWQKLTMDSHLSIYSLATDPAGAVYAGGYGQGLFKSSDDGVSWDSSGLAGYWIVDMDVNEQGDLFLVGIGNTYGSGVFRSVDHGGTWDKVLNLNNYGGINCIHVARDGSIWIGLNYSSDYNGIYRSTDNGTTWDKIFTDTQNFYAVTSKEGGKIFATSYGRIYTSLDNGQNWSYSEQGLSSSEIPAITVNNSGQIFTASSGYGIYLSDDDGANWNRIYSAGPDFSSILIDKNQTIYAGTRGSWIYRSEDNGENWSLLNSGLGNQYVLSLAINTNGYLFSGTDTSGVYRSVQPVVTGIREHGIQPGNFILSQNYPNPFGEGHYISRQGRGNPATVISYQLPVSSFTKLTVYNLLGEKVRTLVSKEQTPGKYKITFDARGLASGVYIYQLKTGNFIQSRKMILLR